MEDVDKAPSVEATAYEATAAWAYGMLSDHLREHLKQAIIREDSIALDWGVSEGATTTTELRKIRGSTFKGDSVWASGTPDELRAVVHAVLYSSDAGHILMGNEEWSDGRMDWFVVHLFNGRTIP